MTIAIVLLGILVGSFLNVVIVRLPKEESIVYPSSHCVNCNQELKAMDLIPVISYVRQCGKCRYCGCNISPQYIVVELLMGFLTWISFYKYGLSIEFVGSFLLEGILVVTAFIDLEHKIIPDELVVAGTAVGVILNIYSFFGKVLFYDVWYSPVVGMFLASGVLYVMSWVGGIVFKTDEAIGLGDIKLFIPIGIILGYKLSMIALMMSILLGGVYGICIVLKNKKNLRKEVPFAPFISVGTIMAMYWGYDIINWYITIMVGGRF